MSTPYIRCPKCGRKWWGWSLMYQPHQKCDCGFALPEIQKGSYLDPCGQEEKGLEIKITAGL